ncbi:MAG: hypothetical protein HYZ60_03930 [Methylocystis sp.]|nr:hypothetical protein [Methylocystis sp.]
MSRFKCGACLALMLVLAACATRTRDIEPDIVDPAVFAGATCAQLVSARAKRSEALIFAGLEQDHTRLEDKVGVLGAPMLMGTLFHWRNDFEIARLKGELRALDALLATNCGPIYR